MIEREPIIQAFISSCNDEINALKPGNVHVFAEGHGMTVEHFLASAAASAPPLTQPGLSVGKRILGAVEASFTTVGMNTNLGILLLCAPLAVAAERGIPNLRTALAEILAGLDRSDADDSYKAITRASPGGLGDAAQHDVHRPAAGTLLEAMAEAAPRDRIAYQYISTFEDVFMTGFTTLEKAREEKIDEPWTAVSIYLNYLSKFPDTHIARKYGIETAEAVQTEAFEILKRFETRKPVDSFNDLIAFDARLKAKKLNPGTSADLTVATLFANRLSSILLRPVING